MSEQLFYEQKPPSDVNEFRNLCGGFTGGVKILASGETTKEITNRK
tara:strand:- start:442 stop:579 length:138 start_codon:yes stop_codon:yes gene_type:complete